MQWRFAPRTSARASEGILSARRHQLSGIINGIDTKVFNPFSDQLIPKRFDKGHLKGKQTCKESLMFDMGLHADIHTPLIAMVTRMTPQKGFDLIERVLDEMMYFDICFLLLGSGAKKYEPPSCVRPRTATAAVSAPT